MFGFTVSVLSFGMSATVTLKLYYFKADNLFFLSVDTMITEETSRITTNKRMIILEEISQEMDEILMSGQTNPEKGILSENDQGRDLQQKVNPL